MEHKETEKETGKERDSEETEGTIKCQARLSAIDPKKGAPPLPPF